MTLYTLLQSTGTSSLMPFKHYSNSRLSSVDTCLLPPLQLPPIISFFLYICEYAKLIWSSSIFQGNKVHMSCQTKRKLHSMSYCFSDFYSADVHNKYVMNSSNNDTISSVDTYLLPPLQLPPLISFFLYICESAKLLWTSSIFQPKKVYMSCQTTGKLHSMSYWFWDFYPADVHNKYVVNRINYSTLAETTRQSSLSRSSALKRQLTLENPKIQQFYPIYYYLVNSFSYKHGTKSEHQPNRTSHTRLDLQSSNCRNKPSTRKP
ncbi:hypothetical protein H5410_038099 [Solanum commersonii]|uniref:Uncharacterized protein n=1 Tax=Solanum commersonii TaxID=4109 RepID=A0A9J5Y826_SOLCO|nr:hypothetical protein H5410_038099 [Solanum commersonii]